ncbi:hypothetical protein PENSUB_4346 [Penicillium subrubescens]|uniref:Uncharacterized protein n=1 Tax=Penicillium subrubescens TaxID=1316194 RepID=A0A1Q5UCH0_9EURO|nr:hypothetical protein PENSUB_4346 [Penicillium subrubescens]
MGVFQQEADAKDGKESPGRVYNGFPISFYVTFDLYSFDGREDFRKQFRWLHPPESKYGWVRDE